jgi:hypothetical protein
MSNGLRVLAILLLLGAFAPIGAKDPYMQSGKTQLQKAQAHLIIAGKDKAGYRDRALSFVYQAIAEVDAGMKSNHHASVPAFDVPTANVSGLSEMRKTLGYLKQAKENLEAAKEDPGGHRNKAIELTAKAMVEVEKALAGSESSG